MRIAMDDFGTGYSNITYVLTIPFQVVKVDKSLIWQAMKDEKAAILIKKMIEVNFSCKKLKFIFLYKIY